MDLGGIAACSTSLRYEEMAFEVGKMTEHGSIIGILLAFLIGNGLRYSKKASIWTAETEKNRKYRKKFNRALIKV